MTDENLIHVKLEHDEALASKRYILSSEMAFLNAIKSIRRYHAIRTEELELRSKLYKENHAVILALRELKKNLPKLDLPEISKKDKEITTKRKKAKTVSVEEDLESQLEDIKQKLKSISG